MSRDQTTADAASFYRLLHERTPRLTITPALLATIVLVYLLMAVSAVEIAFSTTTAIRWGAQYAPGIESGEYWRFLTTMFLHGSPLHLGLNALCLWRLGPFVERLLGPAIFLVLYLLCGVVASVVSLQFGAGGISVGASGAIFGIAGVLLAIVATAGGSASDLLRRRGVTTLSGALGGALTELPTEPPPLPPRHQSMTGILADLRGGLIAFVLSNGLIGFLVPMIDNAAHMGGLAAGLVFGWIVGRHSLDAKPGLIRTLVPAVITVALVSVEVVALEWQLDLDMERGRLAVFDERAMRRFHMVGAEIDAGRRKPADGAVELEQLVRPALRATAARGESLVRTSMARVNAARALDPFGRQVDWRHVPVFEYDLYVASGWLVFLEEHAKAWNLRLEAMRRNEPWLLGQARRRLRAAELRLDTILARPRPRPID
jgi:membrane associated rhomboid family serine protease